MQLKLFIKLLALNLIFALVKAKKKIFKTIFVILLVKNKILYQSKF